VGREGAGYRLDHFFVFGDDLCALGNFAGDAELLLERVAIIFIARPVDQQDLRIRSAEIGPYFVLSGKQLRDFLFCDLFGEVRPVHHDGDAVPGDLERAQAVLRGSGHRNFGLFGLHQIERLRIVVPDDVDVGAGIGFFKRMGQRFDDPLFGPVAGDGHRSGHLG
jgi:hypothetical protein